VRQPINGDVDEVVADLNDVIRTNGEMRQKNRIKEIRFSSSQISHIFEYLKEKKIDFCGFYLSSSSHLFYLILFKI
jgi:hypothetical protein